MRPELDSQRGSRMDTKDFIKALNRDKAATKQNSIKVEPSAESTAIPSINYEELANVIAQKIPAQTVFQPDVGDIDYNILASIIAKNLPTQKQTVLHTDSTAQECTNTKPVCTNKKTAALEERFVLLEELSDTFEEYDLVRVIIENFKSLKSSKALRKTKIESDLLDLNNNDILKEQELSNEKDLMNSEIKKIHKILKNPLLTSSHQDTKSKLDKSIAQINSGALDSVIKDTCATETCFEESDLIRNVCGALKYGGVFDVASNEE